MMAAITKKTVLYFMLVLLLSGFSRPVHKDAFAQRSSSAVRVERNGDLLDVHADRADLREVFRRLESITGIRFLLLGPFQDPVTISFSQTRIMDAVQRLTVDYSTAATFEPVSASFRKGADVATLIWIVDAGIEPPEVQKEVPRPLTVLHTDSGAVQRKADKGPDKLQQNHGALSAGAGPSSDVAFWVDRMTDDALSEEERKKAAMELAYIGDEPATNALSVMMGDPDPALRKHAVRSLGIIGTDYAVQLIGQALYGDPETENRQEAKKVLDLVGSDLARLFLHSP